MSVDGNRIKINILMTSFQRRRGQPSGSGKMTTILVIYFKRCFFSIIATFAFMYTVYTIGLCTTFFSRQDNPIVIKFFDLSSNGTDERTATGVVWPLMRNFFVLFLFIFNHSLLSLQWFKEVCYRLGVSVVQRCIYNVLTSLTLQLIMNSWLTVEPSPIWLIDTRNYLYLFWWIFAMVQYFGWAVIWGGCITMDWGELLGVKQVWYHWQGLGNPVIYKTRDLQRLYHHMRHPSLIGFGLILCVHPHMTLDRLLLAFMFLGYMMSFSRVDYVDYFYQSQQLKRKRSTYFEMNDYYIMH